MNNLYKLSFTDKAQWDGVKTSILLADEDGNIPNGGTYTNNGMTVVEVGHVPIPATYDEEGNKLTEATFHTDYAVDILTEKTLDLYKYILTTTPKNWRHNFTGVDAIVIQTKPTIDWLKNDIKEWLTNNNIEWKTSMNKDELINLI